MKINNIYDYIDTLEDKDLEISNASCDNMALYDYLMHKYLIVSSNYEELHHIYMEVTNYYEYLKIMIELINDSLFFVNFKENIKRALDTLTLDIRENFKNKKITNPLIIDSLNELIIRFNMFNQKINYVDEDYLFSCLLYREMKDRDLSSFELYYILDYESLLYYDITTFVLYKLQDNKDNEVLNSKKVLDSAKKYLLKYDRVYKNYKACSLFNESCDIYEDIDKVNKIYRKVKR